MLVVLLLAAILCSGPRPGGGPAVQNEKKKKIDAAGIYRTSCEACHGPNGKAAADEMRLAGRDWKHGGRLQDLVKTITDGVPGTAMLPFKGRLTDDEIAAVARLVQSWNKPAGGRKKSGAGSR
jgi:mono/diheme cytochrome c family protein